jgi:ABC-type transport system substrate-binding protein
LFFHIPTPSSACIACFILKISKTYPGQTPAGTATPKWTNFWTRPAVELNLEKRKALYAEFQKIISEDLPIIFLHQPAYHTITHQALKGHWTSIWGIVGPVDGLWWTDGRAPQ